MKEIKTGISSTPTYTLISELKRRGYYVTKKNPMPKLLPCKVCGGTRRERWYSHKDGINFVSLVCIKCRQEVQGAGERDAREKWNEEQKKENEG